MTVKDTIVESRFTKIVSDATRKTHCRWWMPFRHSGRRTRHRPDFVIADRRFDAAGILHGLRTRGIVPVLAMRRTAHGIGSGRWRWVVERTFAWLNQFRRLRVRYDQRADIHEASSLARLCADLLAGSAEDLGDRVARTHSAFRSVKGELQSAALLRGNRDGLRSWHSARPLRDP